MKALSLVLSLLLTFVLAGFASADGKEKKPDSDAKPIKKPDGDSKQPIKKPNGGEKKGQDAVAFFKTHDRNGDGVLSLAEFTGGNEEAKQGTPVKKPDPNQPAAKKPNAKRADAQQAKKAAKKAGKKPGAKEAAKKPVGKKHGAKKHGAKKHNKKAAGKGQKKPASVKK